MTAIGYLLIAAAVLVMRQVIVGRVDDMGTDLKDLTVSLLNGDTVAAGEVASRRGENVPSAATEQAADGTTNAFVSPDDTGFLQDFSITAHPFAREVVSLGDAADSYVWGATGPTSYDCSGLIWRAMRNLHLYNGPRFTTATFSRSVGPEVGTEVSSPEIGDIVVWDGRHIGVYIGNDQLYSARSPSKGIGVSSLSGDTSYFSVRPRFWRLHG